MALIHDIRNQPRHIRQLMFGLSVVTTLSLVGMIWFNSFQNNMYALLNPEEQPSTGQGTFATENRSPFSVIKDAVSDAAASLFGIFERSPETQTELPMMPGRSLNVPRLPLSEPR